MNQLSCRKAAPNHSNAGAEDYIRAATYGHICPVSVCCLSADVLEWFTAPSGTRFQTGTTAAAMSTNQSEAERQ